MSFSGFRLHRCITRLILNCSIAGIGSGHTRRMNRHLSFAFKASLSCNDGIGGSDGITGKGRHFSRSVCSRDHSSFFLTCIQTAFLGGKAAILSGVSTRNIHDGTGLGYIKRLLRRNSRIMLLKGNIGLPCPLQIITLELPSNRCRYNTGICLFRYHTIAGRHLSRGFTDSSINLIRVRICTEGYRRCVMELSIFCGGLNCHAPLLAAGHRNGLFPFFCLLGNNSGSASFFLCAGDLCSGYHTLCLKVAGLNGRIMLLLILDAICPLRDTTANGLHLLGRRRIRNISLVCRYFGSSKFTADGQDRAGLIGYDTRLIRGGAIHALSHSCSANFRVILHSRTGGFCLRAGNLCSGISMGRILIRINAACILLAGPATEGRRIVEGTSSLAACHLVPPTSICGCDDTVRIIRLLILRCTVHVHIGRFAVRSGCRGTDMAAGDLSALQLEALHVGHIVTQGAVGNISGDGAGGIGRTGSNGRNRLAVQRGAVSGCHSAEGSCNKSRTAAKAHSGTAVHDRITDIGVGIEFGCEAGCKASCRCTGSGRSSSTLAEHTACRFRRTTGSGDDSGCHKQLHTHTGAGLCHIQPNGAQVAVKPLCAFEICKCAEHPEEDAALSGGQCAAVSDELAH